MSLCLNTQARSSFSRNGVSIAVRGVLAACAVLAISVPSLWADADGQAEIAKFLPTGKTVVTASAKDLLRAVISALNDPANPDSPAELTASALQPLNGKVRSGDIGDVNTLAPAVAGTAVNVILSGTTASPTSDAINVAQITDAVLDVNEPTAKQELSASARKSVLKVAIGLVSDAYATNPALLMADVDLGNTLATDSFLEHLQDNALITLLQGAIVGIAGAKGTSPVVAPLAAEDFVQGIVTSGTLPDGEAYNTFAVAILKNIATNASVDELVANAIGAEFSTEGELVTTATSLYAKYTSAGEITKVTQGLTAVIPAGNDTETNRTTYLKVLTTASVKNAVAIDEGAIYVDPFYASAFTQGSFISIMVSGGDKLAIKDAPGIAKGVGSVLGQDGNELTQVADLFSSLTGSNVLPVAESASYATGLIHAAVTSAVPISEFANAPVFNGGGVVGGGGKLVVGPGISGNTATDLASILDLFAGGIITANGASTPAELKSDEKEITALAKAVADFTKSEDVTISVPNEPASEPVAVYLAGTLGAYIADLSPALGATVKGDLFTAIVKGVTAVTNGTVDPQVKELFVVNSTNPYTNYLSVGAIAVQETTVTNL